MTTPVDTDRIRAVVSACPGVVRVHGRGPNGVSFDTAEVEVHVITRYGVPIPALGARIDRELAPLLGGRVLNLVVDDVRTDEELADDADRDTDDDIPALLPGSAPVAALPAGVEPVAALPPGGSGAQN